MGKRRSPRIDPDNPPWTDADFARARPLREVLPELAAIPRKRRPGERGPQKSPTKIAVSIRLDRDVVEHFRATGVGWQTRLNDALARSIARSGRSKRTSG